MERLAKNLQVRLINGIPGFTVTYASGMEEHFCFSDVEQAESFHQAFGAVLREARYAQRAPGERLAVSESVHLSIQPPEGGVSHG